MKLPAAIIVAISLFILVGCAEQPPEPAERWVVEELGTLAEFRDVFFLDPLNGWIVGGGHNIEGGILGRTTDGGRTWTFRSGRLEMCALASSSRSSRNSARAWFISRM